MKTEDEKTPTLERSILWIVSPPVVLFSMTNAPSFSQIGVKNWLPVESVSAVTAVVESLGRNRTSSSAMK